MKTMKLRKSLEFNGLHKISVINSMAALSISAWEDTKIDIQVEFVPQHEDSESEVYKNLEYRIENGELELEFHEAQGTVRINLSLPKQVPLYVQTENFPLTISDFTSGIKVENENSPMIISNISGGCLIQNENGPIRIRKLEGIVKIETENGPISAEDISSEGLELTSENAPIKLRRCSIPEVKIHSENGGIYYETLPLEQSRMDFRSDNGIVHLALPESFDFHLEAETEFGALKSQIKAEITRDENHFILHSGEGKNQIMITTVNGTIKLSSDSGINLDYLKVKLEELKQAIQNSKSLDDKENIKILAANIIDYLSRGISSIDEDIVKDKLNQIRDKVKQILDNIDLKEAQVMLTETINSIINELHSSLKDTFTNIKNRFGKEFYGKGFHHGTFGEIFDHEKFHKVFEPLKMMKKFQFGFEPKEEVSERSRMKILEMLENGKITAEEAERLLKAINKE